MCGKMSWGGDDKNVDEHVLLVGKIAGQAKRFPEMADHMEAVAARSKYREISFEERNMLSVAFASMIGNKRKELRALGKLEAEELKSGRTQELKWCRMLRKKIEGEYGEICERILRILDDYLIPVATSSDAKVAFLKMKADYHRYSAEFQIETNRRQSAESSLIAYKSAQDVAEKTLPPTNPMRLSVALNLSVFYYDILNCPHFALEVAQEAIDEAEANGIDPEHEDAKDSNTIIQLLKDNLLRWSKNLEGRKSST